MIWEYKTRFVKETVHNTASDLIRAERAKKQIERENFIAALGLLVFFGAALIYSIR